MRARDEASRVIRNVGASFRHVDDATMAAAQRSMALGTTLMGVGTGLATVGAAGLAFFQSATSAASKFNQEAALTLTQVDGVSATIEDMKRIARDVARVIPAPFEELQGALYDIFSSIDVNLQQAEKLLAEFARAAVAGQTEIRGAARATIAILNGLGLPVTDLNRVLDVQFQTVRKGVVTYDELSAVIGLAIPATNRAGQSIETLGGMIAFLTRNGLSASRAATSAARALESFAHPTVVSRLEELGFKIRDARGEFRPLVDVVRDMNARFKDLTAPERAQMLQDLFKGAGGTIQARRFWDEAFKNFDQFEARIHDMGNAAGAMDEAYDIMFEQPQSQMQLLINNWQVLRTEIGDIFLPTISKVVAVGLKLIDVWNSLSPTTQEWIVRITALAAALTTVIGIVTFVAGSFLLLQGAALAAGTSLFAIAGIALLVIAALAAIVAVGYLVYRNWDTIKEVGLATWQAIKDAVQSVVDFFTSIDWLELIHWDAIKDGAVRAFNEIADFFKLFWDRTKDGFGEVGARVGSIFDGVISKWKGFADSVTGFFGDIWQTVQELLSTVTSFINDVVGDLVLFWDENWQKMKKPVLEVWETLKTAFDGIGVAFGEAISHIINLVSFLVDAILGTLEPFLEALSVAVRVALEVVMFLFKWAFVAIVETVKFALNLLSRLWNAFGDDLFRIVVAIWEVIFGVIRGAINIIAGTIKVVLAAINGDWRQAWEGIKQIVDGVWDAIWSIIEGALKIIWSVIKGGLDAIVALFQWLWRILVGNSIIPDIVNGIISWFTFLPRKLWEFTKEGADNVIKGFNFLKDGVLKIFDGAKDWLFEIGKSIIEGLKKGIDAGIKPLKDTLETITDVIPDWKGPAVRDAQLLVENGNLIMQGLVKGIEMGKRDLAGVLGGVTDMVPAAIGAPPVGTQIGTGGTLVIEEGAIQITGVQEPERVAEIIDEKLDEFLRTWRQMQ